MRRMNQYQNSRPFVINRDSSRNNQSKWNALNPNIPHPTEEKTESADQQSASIQQSYESIVIRDSYEVEVTTTETQVAVNLQVAIQAAIALVINISIADSSKADMITQDLKSSLRSCQLNRQETYVENSRAVKITTTDTDVAVNAQLMLQVLIALLVRLDVL